MHNISRRRFLTLTAATSGALAFGNLTDSLRFSRPGRVAYASEPIKVGIIDPLSGPYSTSSIHDVHGGESHLHPTIALKMLRELDNPVVTAANRPLTDDPLTEREVEVLRLVAQGLSNQEIAKTLTISERTVGNHIGSILRKLHLANRTQAALYALRRGLVDINSAPIEFVEEPPAEEMETAEEEGDEIADVAEPRRPHFHLWQPPYRAKLAPIKSLNPAAARRNLGRSWLRP